MSLAEHGLAPGDTVRFRRRARGRWRTGVVLGEEKDGSVSLRDHAGAWRAVFATELEVLTRGPRGARVWRPAVVGPATVPGGAGGGDAHGAGDEGRLGLVWPTESGR